MWQAAKAYATVGEASKGDLSSIDIINALRKDSQRQYNLIVVNLSDSGNDRDNDCSILKAINIPIPLKLAIRRLPQNQLSSPAWLKVISTPDFVKSVLKAAPKLRHINLSVEFSCVQILVLLSAFFKISFEMSVVL
ncbi:hypothetical protein GJ496_010171 [Pomphorhynchus laevis]|nr:hypothetical protein GJ496_011184 [Pomphorhynchus laevis]KAI0981398.1 hypothetical protein GJ496_010171 [Pomphorhynchus laevis]